MAISSRTMMIDAASPPVSSPGEATEEMGKVYISILVQNRAEENGNMLHFRGAF